jgi:hypothetical protein
MRRSMPGRIWKSRNDRLPSLSRANRLMQLRSSGTTLTRQRTDFQGRTDRAVSTRNQRTVGHPQLAAPSSSMTNNRYVVRKHRDDLVDKFIAQYLRSTADINRAKLRQNDRTRSVHKPVAGCL